MNLWKDYSISYLKRNKAACISIIIAAFISSVLLSLTCGVFYNIWTDGIRLIKLEEGDWQAKLTGELSEEDIQTLQYHPNIKEVILEKGQDGQENSALLYFYNQRRIYADLPKLAGQLDRTSDGNSLSATYHEKLLSQYFIFSPEEKKNPPLILFVYLFTLIVASLSLILIIHNAFEVSMDARLHQLGILQSIGATPKQLRFVLTAEALVLSLLPIIIGVSAGVGLCYGFMRFIAGITGSVRKYDLIFMYHPVIYLAALLVSVLTVWLSARIPARKISRMNPLQAIQNGRELPVKKMKRFFLLSHLFGIEGELARKSLYVRRRAFRTSSLSITLAFLVFSSFLNLEAISDISTQYTFFERYKDKWDLMLTVTEAGEQNQRLLQDIRAIPGVESCISYQKASASTAVVPSAISDALTAAGGIDALKDSGIKTDGQESYTIDAPVIIMDDESFARYGSEAGADPALFTAASPSGSILVNTVWDSSSSNRRNKKILPFIRELDRISLRFEPESGDNKDASDPIPVNITAMTDKMPVLREEIPDYALLQIMSDSYYREITAAPEMKEHYYNILTVRDEIIPEVEAKVKELLSGQNGYTLESRLEKEESNVKFRNAYKIGITSLVGLLAVIGLANVFTNTLGHLQQRRKELVRYLTVGLTPGGTSRLFLIEAFILAAKPILISLVINIPLVLFALSASLIPAKDFLQRMPVLPVAIFALIILLCVGIAYYIGGKKICTSDLMDTLKDDTMV